MNETCFVQLSLTEPHNGTRTFAHAGVIASLDFVVAIGIAVAGLNAKVAASDRINLRDGKSISGSVQSESPIEVVIQTSAGTQKVDVSRIDQIHYDGQPALMTHARAMEESARLSQAADEFAKAQAELKAGSFAFLAAQFGEARVRARLAIDEGGNADDAIGRLEQFESGHPESRHHFVALELLGRLYLEKKDFGKARQSFKALADAPWLQSKLRATALFSRVLSDQGKHDEALERIEPFLKSATESAEQESALAELLLEKGRCLRGLNRRAEELAILQQAIDHVPASASALEAQAYVLIGDANRSIGRPWDAVWAFLHVQLLFARHEELHARALYNLWELWNELGRPERAAAAASALESEHPKSPWTKSVANKRSNSD